MNAYTLKNCRPQTDRTDVVNLFYAIKDELYLPDRAAVEKMVDLIFARGGVTGGYLNGKLVGALGYFFGDPAEDFANTGVLFMYVGAILPAYRGTRLFNQGLTFTLRQMKQRSVREIRLQAEATNPFTNKLYGRFANAIGRGKSLRGKDVITYGNDLEAALSCLTRRKRPHLAHHHNRAAALPSPR